MPGAALTPIKKYGAELQERVTSKILEASARKETTVTSETSFYSSSTRKSTVAEDLLSEESEEEDERDEDEGGSPSEEDAEEQEELMKDNLPIDTVTPAEPGVLRATSDSCKVSNNLEDFPQLDIYVPFYILKNTS